MKVSEEDLSPKAALLLLDFQVGGGGALMEFDILKRTGLSHGSFSAARKELVEGGFLLLGKCGRQTVYTLTDKARASAPAGFKEKEPAPPQDKATGGKAVSSPLKAPAAGGQVVTAGAKVVKSGGKVVKAGRQARNEQIVKIGAEARNEEVAASAPGDLPQVTGEFGSVEEWEEQLIQTIPGCLDITPSLVDEGEYTVYAHAYGAECVYAIEEVAGGCVVRFVR